MQAADDRGLTTDDSMDIADWRKKIDEIDQKLVEILNQRAQAAQEIGRLKRKAAMPVYEPDRERIVLYARCRKATGGRCSTGI